MLARIGQPEKSAMQSGKARTDAWELRFEASAALRPDPLMGWTTTTDTTGQVRLLFDTRDQAIDYARRHGIAFEVTTEGQPSKPIIRAYADNFAADRKVPWTH